MYDINNQTPGCRSRSLKLEKPEWLSSVNGDSEYECNLELAW